MKQLMIENYRLWKLVMNATIYPLPFTNLVLELLSKK